MLETVVIIEFGFLALVKGEDHQLQPVTVKAYLNGSESLESYPKLGFRFPQISQIIFGEDSLKLVFSKESKQRTTLQQTETCNKKANLNSCVLK